MPSTIKIDARIESGGPSTYERAMVAAFDLSLPVIGAADRADDLTVEHVEILRDALHARLKQAGKEIDEQLTARADALAEAARIERRREREIEGRDDL